MTRNAEAGARRLAAALTIAAAIFAPAGAAAQIWIGQIAGEMAAQQARAAAEAACRAGTPAPPEVVAKATTAANDLMTGYFALKSTSKARDMGRVFAVKTEGVSWKSGDGVKALTDLGAALDEPTPALKPVSFVVAGDAVTARGVWEVDLNGKPAWYAVDFTQVSSGLFSSAWRIWHMTLVAGDAPPAAPGAYCHYDPEQAW